MAIAVISIDTETQECVLTLNGALVGADEIYFSKGTNHDGIPYKDFSYSEQTTDSDGIMKKTMYRMVPKDYPDSYGGLVSKEVKTKDKLYKEVEAFITKNTD